MKTDLLFKTSDDMFKDDPFLEGRIGPYFYYGAIGHDLPTTVYTYENGYYVPYFEEKPIPITHLSFNKKDYPVDQFDFVGSRIATGCNYVFVEPKIKLES